MKIFLLAVFCLFAAACTKEGSRSEITIGFNPAENSDVVEANGKAFSEFYKKATGLTVKTFVATDYTALIEAMRAGRIDFAFLPAFSYVKAEEMAHAKLLLRAVRDGQTALYSAIITRADRGLNTLKDLKGKNIAWVDPASSSGFIVPKATLITKEHIDPDTYFKRQVYAGSHDALVLSVLNGTVDAGATFANDAAGKVGSWHQYLKSEADQKKLKMIYVSDPIPGDTFSTTESFAKAKPELVEKTVKMLTEMGNSEEGRQILKALYHIDSMIPANTADYQSLRDAAKAVGVK
ncbi:MAG: phosphate/phosphite/phosphonate ABC transporter substrate-binding protein [Proteobacteria bacterium]|nr:MAG: phosphate/phosphite/phosphonate ABC transporter substrate-binding protein [Pseudomonadota bacterium]